MIPGFGCASSTCAIALYVLLALTTLGVNAFSTKYALTQVRTGRERPPAARADGLLLLTRCLTFLFMAVVAVGLWKYPYWLIGVALATTVVQALDLGVGISQRLRDKVLAALLGLAIIGSALVLFVLLGGAYLS